MWPGETDEEQKTGNVQENQVAMKKVERTGEMVSMFHYEAKVAEYSTQLEDWLYLGNATNAASRKQCLETKGHVITHCLNCRMNGKTPFKEIDYCVLKLVNEPAEDIIKQVKIANEFIMKVKKQKDEGKDVKLLIHCDDKPEQSRATAILVGYLMTRDKQRFKEAMAVVKKARDAHYQKMVKPNHGFHQQLMKMYKTIR